MSINNKDNYYILYKGSDIICVVDKTKLAIADRWRLLEHAKKLNLTEDSFYKQKFHGYCIGGAMSKKLDEIGVSI